MAGRKNTKTKAKTKKSVTPVPEVVPALSLGDVFNRKNLRADDSLIDEKVREIMAGQSDLAWDQILQQLMLNSCAFFAQEVLRGDPDPPYHGRFVIGEHHEEWDDLIMRYNRLCVEAARDHGKTFFFDLAYPIWKSVRQPRSIGYIFSATKDQAIRILADVKTELESNKKLQYLVPPSKVGARWSATAIRLTNGSVIYARSFGTKVRGAHPHWIVVDDGLNDDDMYSEVTRRKNIEYFYSAISNMIVPGGQIIVIGTPFHASDLYADLSVNSEYHFVRYKAIREDGSALWSLRYSLELLAQKRREIGNIRFTREFLCEPISDEMSLFPSYLFHNPLVQQPTARLGMPQEYWIDQGIKGFYMGVDFALSSSVQADYTVIWVMGVDECGNRQIIEIVRGRGLPYQAQLSKINEIGRLYNCGLIFVEANQAQRIFGDELIRTTDLPIKLYTTGTEKNSLDKGVPSLRIPLENAKWRIPRGDARSVEMTNIWIEEMRSFTWLDGKLQSAGAHDDTVMASWICEQAIRQGGFSFDFGEDAVDAAADIDDMLELANSGKDGFPEMRSGESDDMIIGAAEGSNDAGGNLMDDEDLGQYDMPSMLAALAQEAGKWY